MTHHRSRGDLRVRGNRHRLCGARRRPLEPGLRVSLWDGHRRTALRCGRDRVASPCMGPIPHLGVPPSTKEPPGVVHRSGDVPSRSERRTGWRHVAAPRSSRGTPQPLVHHLEAIGPFTDRGRRQRAQLNLRYRPATGSSENVKTRSRAPGAARSQPAFLRGARWDKMRPHLGTSKSWPPLGTISSRADGSLLCHLVPWLLPVLVSAVPYNKSVLAVTAQRSNPSGD